MLAIRFVKMHGAGNDYIIIDGIADPVAADAHLAVRLADRHFGVGGDGVILLTRSDRADCRMSMWNIDGSRGAMCGNGLRCLAKLAFDRGHVPKARMVVETDSGDRGVELLFAETGRVVGARIDMGAVRVDTVQSSLLVAGEPWSYYRGEAGNPHAVVFSAVDPECLPVARVGAAFQAQFDGGVNVAFVRVLPDGSLQQRTFERGSGETLACGTGATVAACVAMATGRVPGPVVPVKLRGGTLTIRRDGSGLVLEGPAVTVCTGEAWISGSP